jgi:DHA1 family tetracycline resistance protein-like MFS transporter
MRARLPLVFVLITVMIDAMGIGIIIPVMPMLIMEIEGGTLSNAALWGGLMASSFAVMQFLFGPLIGNLSDRFGRRPVLLISLAVMAADYLVMALAGSMWLLLLGRIVGGIAGATHATAAAFIADTSTPEKRGAGFGLVSAAFGLGFVMGPVIGGLLGDLGPRAPFWAAAALATANLILGLIVLPESLTPETRRAFSIKRANPFGALTQIRAHPALPRLLTVLLLAQLAFNVYPAIWAYYTQASFGWDPAMIGVSLAAFGICMAVVQGGLIGRIIAKIGERHTVRLGLVFAVTAFLVLGLVTNGWLALAFVPVAAIAAMTVPALHAIMSRDTAANAQGELQGLFSSTNALAMILSPLVMTWVFALATRPGGPVFLPGAPFLAALALCLVALLLFQARPTPARTYDTAGRFPP